MKHLRKFDNLVKESEYDSNWEEYASVKKDKPKPKVTRDKLSENQLKDKIQDFIENNMVKSQLHPNGVLNHEGLKKDIIGLIKSHGTESPLDVMWHT